MIRDLYRALDDAAARRLTRMLTVLTLYCLTQGFVFVLVIPFVSALVAGADTAWVWGGALLTAALTSAVLFFVQARAGYRSSSSIMSGLQHRIGEATVRLPLGWFVGSRSGQIGQMATKNTEDIGSITAHLLEPVLSAVIAPSVVVVSLLFWDWRLGLVGCLLFPVAFVLLVVLPPLTGGTGRAVDAATAVTNTAIVDYALAQPELRSAGRTGRDYPPLAHALDELASATNRQYRAIMAPLAISSLLAQLWLLALLATAAALVIAGDLAPAVGIALLIISVRFVAPLAGVVDFVSAVRTARSALVGIEAFTSEPTLAEPESPAAAPATLDVEFDDVTFGYGDEPVLTGVSFRADAGAVTALVGPSGAGKSTLLSLIARFWDVDAGRVLIGGVDVRDLGSERVIGLVSIVFQDVYLFEGSILDNVRMGPADATDDEVREAMRLARVTEIIERLPDGELTQVGEGGLRLSGGERQRVSIARALLKDAPIVLLDEATSALDAHGERAVVEAITELARGRTVITIAHRLETIREADRIVVLEGGAVSALGDHYELATTSESYRRFWASRESSAGWRIQTTPPTP